MNILILGSEGLIGSALGDYLWSRGHNIFCFDIKRESVFEDLRTPKGRENLLNRIIRDRIDKVVFLAFQVGGSKFLKEHDKTTDYLLDNTSIMANTFDVLKNTKVPFLFASTQMSNMFDTNYGFLKNLGERFTRSLGNQGRICRFWNVYGYEHNSDTSKNHVITDFLCSAKSSGVIQCRTRGNEVRQFLHTEDCSKAIETWVDDKWVDPNKYYDITSFEWVKIKEVANIIADLTNSNVEYGIEGDIQTKVNEPEKTILEYWKPSLTLQKGIETLL